VRLKDGEWVELGVLSGPDDSAFARQLRTLLSHKGRIWQWQIEQSLGRQFADAESLFYVVSRGGAPLANVMTVEARGVGTFGHVFTRPDERRKGMADVIIRHLMADFRRRGGRALYLGTGYDSPAYHIYARHGFESVEPGSGHMAWFAQGREAFEKEAFAPAPTKHEGLSFEHWPTLPALAMMRHPARVRIVTMDVVNEATTEGGALPVLMAMSKASDNTKWNGARAQVAMSTKSGVPVAIACAMPEHYFWKDVDVLDAFCAPGFEGEMRALVEELKLAPERAAVAYADGFWPAKQELLRACGFRRAAALPRHFRTAERAQDVELWTLGG
jgi:GNAT superfamily N-acetyltransferase